MFNWYLDEAFNTYEERLNEARRERLIRAVGASPRPRLRQRAKAKLGGWLVAIGRRLQGQDGAYAAPPAIVVLGTTSVPGSDAANRV